MRGGFPSKSQHALAASAPRVLTVESQKAAAAASVVRKNAITAPAQRNSVWPPIFMQRPVSGESGSGPVADAVGGPAAALWESPAAVGALGPGSSYAPGPVAMMGGRGGARSLTLGPSLLLMNAPQLVLLQAAPSSAMAAAASRVDVFARWRHGEASFGAAMRGLFVGRRVLRAARRAPVTLSDDALAWCREVNLSPALRLRLRNCFFGIAIVPDALACMSASDRARIAADPHGRVGCAPYSAVAERLRLDLGLTPLLSAVLDFARYNTTHRTEASQAADKWLDAKDARPRGQRGAGAGLSQSVRLAASRSTASPVSMRASREDHQRTPTTAAPGPSREGVDDKLHSTAYAQDFVIALHDILLS